MIDQNRDGFIDKEDLHDMLASLGKCVGFKKDSTCPVFIQIELYLVVKMFTTLESSGTFSKSSFTLTIS